MDNNFKAPKVKDMMTKKIMALRQDFSQLDAIQIFNEYRISAAPVVDEKNEVIGYLSESDCIKCMSNCLYYDESKYQTIGTIMAKEVAFAQSEWDIFELEEFFLANHLRSAPVVDTNNHLIGIVTRRDALLTLEKLVHGREEYKRKIKSPIELNMQERIRMIIENVELKKRGKD